MPVVLELRSFGHDVLTVQETGNANRAVPDEEVLKFATSNKRALLTLNRLHFIRLHRIESNHAGMIVCTFDPDFLGQARRIHEAIQGAVTLNGKLIRVNRFDVLKKPPGAGLG